MLTSVSHASVSLIFYHVQHFLSCRRTALPVPGFLHALATNMYDSKKYVMEMYGSAVSYEKAVTRMYSRDFVHLR